MPTKGFLIPIGAAVAALLPIHGAATPVVQQVPNQLRPTPSSLHYSQEAVSDTVMKELTYPLGSELHSLILRQAESSLIYAGHGSHHSHYSHQSHRSHRSGY